MMWLCINIIICRLKIMKTKKKQFIDSIYLKCLVNHKNSWLVCIKPLVEDYDFIRTCF